MTEKEKKGDLIGTRMLNAIVESGANILNWNPISADDAWKKVAPSQEWWGAFVDNRQELPGGLVEKPIRNPFSHETVAWCFIGLKDLNRPDGWRKGVIGFEYGVLPIGFFPNKI